MAEINTTKNELIYEGFISTESETVQIYRTRQSSDPSSPERTEPSAPPGAARFDGPMIDLVDLLNHYKVQFAVLERLPDEPTKPETSDQVTAYADSVAEKIRDRLVSVGLEFAEAEMSIEDLVPPNELAGTMATLIPRLSTWSAEIGPFYDAKGVALIAGLDSAAIPDLVDESQILELTTSDGVKVYPSFQFTADGRVVGGLPQILFEFNDDVDAWMVASWLVSPMDQLDGTPMGAISSEDDFDRVLALAKETAARWSR